MSEKLDIKYKNNGLSSMLSNLYPHSFIFDGYKMASMEGFLQSLKIPYRNIKEQVFSLYGYDAWSIGQKYDWTINQKLYWIYEPIDRHSIIYKELITRAYDELYDQNEEYQKAIFDSLKYKIDHTIGHSDPNKTIMTKKEFLYQLNRLRKKAKPNKFFDLNSLFKI